MLAPKSFWKETDSTDIQAEDAIHEGHGTILRRLFFRNKSRLAVNFDIWELAAGVSEGNHSHDHDEALEEIYYFLQGHGKMMIAGQELPVGPGDAVLVPAGVGHGLYNTGTQPLRLVLLFGEPQASQE